MAKKVESYIKLQVKAGEANPSPPVGTALGPHGLNIMDFCKTFNDRSMKLYEKGTVLPVVISVFKDRSFDFVIKTPPAAVLLKKAAGLTKASQTPPTIVGRVTVDQVVEIAHTKMQDLTASGLLQAVNIIAGTARSMGIEIEGDLDAVA